MNPRLTKIALAIGAPVLALLAAFLITSLVLVLAGDDVGGVWGQILSLPTHRGYVNIINSATVYYLSAIAVAIGFRMNLFNIGVDGQYRVAAFAAAVVAGEGWLPGYFNTALAMLAAVLVGAAWAGIAGLLRVTRGVSEVISTIMLNAIATALVAYLLARLRSTTPAATSPRRRKSPRAVASVASPCSATFLQRSTVSCCWPSRSASPTGSSSTRRASASTCARPAPRRRQPYRAASTSRR